MSNPKMHYKAMRFSHPKGYVSTYIPCGCFSFRLTDEVAEVTCKKCIAWIKRIDKIKIKEIEESRHQDW